MLRRSIFLLIRRILQSWLIRVLHWSLVSDVQGTVQNLIEVRRVMRIGGIVTIDRKCEEYL